MFDAALHRFNDSGAEDHPLQQRIGRQTVGPMHSGTGDLAGGPEPGQRTGTIEIGDDATAQVMRRRGDGKPVATRVESGFFERTGDRGKAFDEMIESGRVEPAMIDIEFEHAPGHRPTHLITREQFIDKLDTGGVTQQRAMAAQRLGEQRPGHAGMMQRRGMELDELDIGHRNTGPQSHGHAVASGLDRVGRDGEELASSTSGEQHMTGPNHSRDARAIGRPHAHAAPCLNDEVERELVLVDGRRRPTNRGNEGPFDLGASGSTAGVHDTSQRMTTFAGEFESTLIVPIERGTQRDEIANPARTFLDEHPHGVDVAEPGTGGQRVGQMQIGGIGIATQNCGHPALGPAGGGLLEITLGEHAYAEPVRFSRSYCR